MSLASSVEIYILVMFHEIQKPDEWYYLSLVSFI